MDTPYLIDSDNADYVNGKSNRPPGTPSWLTWLILGLPTVLCSIALLCGIVAYQHIHTWKQLDKHGVITDGIYTDLPRSEFGATGRVGGAEYRYHVMDTLYTGKGSIANATLVSTHEGDPVKIKYLPDDPKVSYPAQEPLPKGALFTALIFFVIGSAFGYGAYMIRASTRRWRTAVLVMGQVAGVNTTEDQEKETATSPENTLAKNESILQYSFISPLSGQTIMAEKTIDKATADSPHPEKGRVVAIRFLDDNNYFLL